jgi:hypothetical protein
MPLLKGIYEGVRRATNIVSSLNYYSRVDKKKTAIDNIHQTIDNCLVMLHNQLKTKVEIILFTVYSLLFTVSHLINIQHID